MESWRDMNIGNYCLDKDRKPFILSLENQHKLCYFMYATEDMKKRAGIELPEDLIFVNELQNYYKEVTGEDLEIGL